MSSLSRLLGAAALGLTLTACGRTETAAPPPTTAAAVDEQAHDGGAHAHDGGDHSHDEIALGTTRVGELTIECWQEHGDVAPGKESHLVVKLPHDDGGSSIVRAWIGTADRFASIVNKGVYASSHDDYDIHADAPDPLPADAAWWIEIELPDGTTQVGSIAFK